MIKSIEQIDSGEYIVPKTRRSTKYCLEWHGRQYNHFPPKEVIRQAYALRTGQELWGFSGGEEANSFCRDLGFEIIKDCGRAPH